MHFSSDGARDKQPHKSAGMISPAVSARLFHIKDRQNAQHDVLNGTMKVGNCTKTNTSKARELSW